MLAVIFDLDGTLIDSEPDIRAALNRCLAKRGLAPFGPGEVRRMIGDGAKILVERGFAARGETPAPEDFAGFIADLEANSANKTVVYPGIPAALAQLRDAGHRLAVCTNKPEAAARNVLAALGLAPYFAAITGGDATLFRKPDPRHLAAALAALDAPYGVMVGDHHNDIAAAAGLGMPSIFVTWGYGETTGTYTAHQATELPGIIAGIPLQQG